MYYSRNIKLRGKNNFTNFEYMRNYPAKETSTNRRHKWRRSERMMHSPQRKKAGMSCHSNVKRNCQNAIRQL